MNKVRSDTVLDMNLEKSRVKELVSVHKDTLTLYPFECCIIISQ